MSFGFPTFFWAALALIPLAAAYLIRTRPRRQPVNTFFLWEQIFQEKASSSLFQRLRHLLSLLLLALAFLAAVFALAGPRLDTGETPDLVIIIDRSASMQTVENDTTRLATAKETAASWITALSGSQRAAIASVADRVVYHSNLSNRTRRLNDALDSVTPTDVPLSSRALAELAHLGPATASSKTRIYFLTDLQSHQPDLPPEIEIVPIGESSPNIGITAADLRWKAPGQATLFTTLTSTFPEDREVELEIVSATDRASLVRLFNLNVPAEGDISESIEINGIQPGPWLLRATKLDDSLALDNAAPLGLNAPQAIPVQVKAENPFFFNQVITAFSRADSLFEPIDDFASLSLSQGNPPETETAVVFAPDGESPLWKNPGEPLPPGPPEIVSPDHPLLARVDPSLLDFDGARQITPPKGSVIVLAHADGTPLLYTISTPDQSAVVFNFDPTQNDFFLSPTFPVFVHDAAVLLTGRNNSFPSAIPTGNQIEIPGTENTGTATLLENDTEKSIPFQTTPDIRRVGNYTFTRNATQWNLGGALLAPAESATTPEKPTPPDFQPAAGWPLALWFLLAAVLVLLAEEALYHRRKVG